MKRKIALILALFMAALGTVSASGREEQLYSVAEESAALNVTVDAYCNDYNKVGNEWYCSVAVNDTLIVDYVPVKNDEVNPTGELITEANQPVSISAGDTVVIYAGIEEFDKGKK